MTKLKSFILLTLLVLLALILAIAPKAEAQNTAVMNISVNVVSGSVVSSEMNKKIDVLKEKVTVGELNLVSDESQEYLINLDHEVQIKNNRGEAIQIATSFSEIQQNSNGKRKYLIEGKVKDKSGGKKGLFKGKISATINYL